MRKVDELFARYGESHRHPRNKAIHWVCVPLITWSLLALLWACVAGRRVRADRRSRSLFYLSLSLAIAIGMLARRRADGLSADAARRGDACRVAIAVFVARVDRPVRRAPDRREKPSFVEDLRFLLVGPAWLLADVYRRVGIPF